MGVCGGVGVCACEKLTLSCVQAREPSTCNYELVTMAPEGCSQADVPMLQDRLRQLGEETCCGRWLVLWATVADFELCVRHE